MGRGGGSRGKAEGSVSEGQRAYGGHMGGMRNKWRARRLPNAPWRDVQREVRVGVHQTRHRQQHRHLRPQDAQLRLRRAQHAALGDERLRDGMHLHHQLPQRQPERQPRVVLRRGGNARGGWGYCVAAACYETQAGDVARQCLYVCRRERVPAPRTWTLSCWSSSVVKGMVSLFCRYTQLSSMYSCGDASEDG